MRIGQLTVTASVIGLIASAVSGVACGAPSDTENANVSITQKGTDPRIIGGTPSTAAQDATVFINLADGFCTGSLIAPNLVLTARHCVTEMAGNDDCQHFTTDNDPATIGIALGVDASAFDTPTIVAHGTKLYVETNPSGCSYDIALIKLDQDIPNAAIAKVRFTQATTADVGTAIGYGDGDDKGNMTNGRYQRGGIAVTAIGPDTTATYTTAKGKTLNVDVSPGELMTGESTCFGDSGGPLLDAAGLIIGVTSRGVDDFCVDRPTIWSDVFSHLTLIEAAATDAGHPLTPQSTTPDAGTTEDAGTSSSSSSSSSSGSLGDTDAGNTTDHASDDTTTTTSGCSAAPSTSRAGGKRILAAIMGVALAIVARRRRR